MMSGFKGLVKEGWHPKGNDGGRESWRGDFKGINQVAGWVGKGKSTGGGSAPAPRASRPISSLRDPASFGPPPQRGKTNTNTNTTTTAGTGVRPAPPPIPRRSMDTQGQGQTQNKPSLPPRLPPRRAEMDAAETNTEPPPAYELAATTPTSTAGISTAASAAANRLGAAGVSVPAFGINKTTNHNQNQNNMPVSVSPQTTQAMASVAQSELQQRFNQMNRSVPPPPQSTTTSTPVSPLTTNSTSTPPPPPQRSSTERTSSNPSLNAFRERHNEHIQAGMSKLSGLDQKYGISKKINSFIEDQKSPAYPQGQGQAQGQAQTQCQCQHGASTSPPPPPPVHPNHPYAHQHSNTSSATDLNKRKPPPPPPPMKPGSLTSNAVQANSPSPPPLPLNTKPR
ncbi:hypothetical protein A7D00_7196 [Trichophyton violaceum]|uniref:Uncharacterized protein n=1 Tax=Trichophyton violaceum TaxID=34388 RepID=A0A178F8Y9_TRIVO|nr:hypothetical protein A7D00_7196 [Trichophyton violaceum]